MGAPFPLDTRSSNPVSKSIRQARTVHGFTKSFPETPATIYTRSPYRMFPRIYSVKGLMSGHEIPTFRPLKQVFGVRSGMTQLLATTCFLGTAAIPHLTAVISFG